MITSGKYIMIQDKKERPWIRKKNLKALIVVILRIALRKTGITSVLFEVGSKLHTLFRVMNIVGMELKDVLFMWILKL